MATDSVGLVQPTPPSAQATTEVIPPVPPPPAPPPPPPLVTVTSVVDKLNKKHLVTEVFVIFSGPVNSSAADNNATYHLATPGKKNSYTAKNAGVIKLKNAAYSPSSNAVALTPKRPFALSKPVQVLIYGTGPMALQDADGRDIDGDDNGTPGGNAIAIIAKKGVTIAARTEARSAAMTFNAHAAAIDSLLVHHPNRVRERRGHR